MEAARKQQTRSLGALVKHEVGINSAVLNESSVFQMMENASKHTITETAAARGISENRRIFLLINNAHSVA